MSGAQNRGRRLRSKPLAWIWWNTLPFEGWTWYDGEPGAVPCPWWAHPLAWVHRVVDRIVDPWR